jgi:hypothetical protein
MNGNRREKMMVRWRVKVAESTYINVQATIPGLPL